MQRDMRLIRAILLAVEQRSKADSGRPLVVEGYDASTVEYHTVLAIDGGLLEADENQSNGNITFQPTGLTLEGRSLLRLARDEDTWNRTLRRCELCIRTIPFDVFHAMLAHEAVTALGT